MNAKITLLSIGLLFSLIVRLSAQDTTQARILPLRGEDSFRKIDNVKQNDNLRFKLQERSEINTALRDRHERYLTWETRFRYGYFACIVLSLVATALSGLVLKLDSMKNRKNITDIAAGLAAFATFLQILNTSTGLNTRYVANRSARSAIEELQIRVNADNYTKNEVWAKIAEIHHEQSKL